MAKIGNKWEGNETPEEIRDLEAMADLLAFAAEPVQPSSNLRERVLASMDDSDVEAGVAKAASAEEQAPFVIAGEAAPSSHWRTILPGVHVRALARETNPAYKSTMMRMEPGSEYPAHVHGTFEEVCVLEGDCYFDDFVMGPGDYYQARPGSEHGLLKTRHGCVMFITEVGAAATTHEEE